MVLCLQAWAEFFWKVLEKYLVKYQVFRLQVQVSTSTFDFFKPQVQVSTKYSDFAVKYQVSSTLLDPTLLERVASV